MCVIMLAQSARPSTDMIQKAWAANDDGAGIAWRENGEVHWRKGLMTVDLVEELCEKLPLPYVVHFRVASVGGVEEALTHPFLVSVKAPLLLEGKTKGAVLFHNGHWAQWNDKVLDAAIASNNKIPSGVWSDTRGIAYLVAIYGSGFMDILTTQKGIIFGPTNFGVYTGQSGWIKINDVWCSNDNFWKKQSYTPSPQVTNYGRRVCNQGKCMNTALPGKDMCYACDQQHAATTKPVAGAAGAAVAGAPVVTAAALPAVGGTGNSHPFAGKTILSVKEAEIMHRRGEMSKATLKKFRREHQILESKTPKAEKALVRLKALTTAAALKLSSGQRR